MRQYSLPLNAPKADAVASNPSPSRRQLPPAHHPRKRVPLAKGPHLDAQVLEDLDLHANIGAPDARLPPLHPAVHPARLITSAAVPSTASFTMLPGSRSHSAPSSRSVSPEVTEEYLKGGPTRDDIVYPSLCPPTPDMFPVIDALEVNSQSEPPPPPPPPPLPPPPQLVIHPDPAAVPVSSERSSEPCEHSASAEASDTSMRSVSFEMVVVIPEPANPRPPGPSQKALRRSKSSPAVADTAKPPVPDRARHLHSTAPGGGAGAAAHHHPTAGSKSLNTSPNHRRPHSQTRRPARSRPTSPGRSLSPPVRPHHDRHARSMPVSMPASRPASRPVSPTRATSPRRGSEAARTPVPHPVEPPYDGPREGILRLRVVKAWALIGSDLLKMTVDVFIKISVGRSRITTTVKRDCVDPLWNESFLMPIALKRDQQPAHPMLVEVMEKCGNRDQVLGALQCDLGHLRHRAPVTKVLKLFDGRAALVCNAPGSGKLQVELEALDFGSPGPRSQPAGTEGRRAAAVPAAAVTSAMPRREEQPRRGLPRPADGPARSGASSPALTPWQ
eukprot:EG_transcript_6427